MLVDAEAVTGVKVLVVNKVVTEKKIDSQVVIIKKRPARNV